MDALSLVPDVPEDALVKVLKAVIAGQDSESMTDRIEQRPPSLTDFVMRMMKLPTSPGALRVAFKRHLTVEEVTDVLEVLEKILDCELKESWTGVGGKGENVSAGTSKKKKKQRSLVRGMETSENNRQTLSLVCR